MIHSMTGYGAGHARISRGTVTVLLFVRPVHGAARILVDEAHARALIARLKRVATRAGLKPEGTLDTLLSVPSMVRIRSAATGIERRAPSVAAQYSERLAKRFDEMKKRLGVDVDPVRIMTEAGLFSERVDITEEITRMRSHLDQITDVLGGSGSSGKRLDFILQELFREITTIGNKANSVDISRHAIAIKEELEMLREQAQNIE